MMKFNSDVACMLSHVHSFLVSNCLRFAIPAEAISGTRRGTLELQDFSKTKKKYKKCSWRRGEAVLTRTCQKGEKRSGLQYLFELESNDECLQERHQRSEFMRWQEVGRG